MSSLAPPKPPEVEQCLRQKDLTHHERAGSPPSSLDSLNQRQARVRTASAPKRPGLAPQTSSDSNERSSSSSNAENWFERSNANGKSNVNPPMFDDDPPFYLDNPDAAEDHVSDRALPSDSPPRLDPTFYSLPVRTAPSVRESYGSSSEDYRGVIDDLTIENRELKQRLRRFENLYASHLEQEKLFEVKIHGLPAHKRRVLEGALREFAESLDAQPEKVSATTPIGSGKLSETNLSTQMASSSSTSWSRPVDSAYASNATSGATSINPSSHPSNQEKIRPQQLDTTKSNNKKVRSYLHDISGGLLPRHSPVMSDKTKRKVVVRRLEQLFTGKASDKSMRSQPLQQQEVSQSAAQDDRRAKRASGIHIHSEGAREANMLSSSVGANIDVDMAEADLNNGHQGVRNAISRRESDESMGEDSPDQRPTRPLDLDPYRAQNPDENIKYLRHLGLSSPKLSPVNSDLGDEGWVYLNLLTNLAQLHTINVTPEFIRNAVASVSSKFELSHDGRKVRWKGGHDGTKMSSDSGSNGEADVSNSSDDVVAGETQDLKRRRLNSGQTKSSIPLKSVEFSGDAPRKNTSNREVLIAQSLEAPVQKKPSPDFTYRPMFFRRTLSDDVLDFDDLEEDSPQTSADRERLRVGTSSGRDVRYSDKRVGFQSGLQGSLIFYRSSHFCTDLSGDHGLTSGSESSSEYINGLGSDFSDTASFVRTSPLRLSKSDSDELSSFSAQGGADEDGPLLEGLDAAEFPSGTAALIPPSPPPRHFDVSGLGGIQPADNFAINVLTQHTKTSRKALISPFSAPRFIPKKILHSIPESTLAAFKKNTQQPDEQISSSVIRTKRVTLPPSDLPPPSYAFLSTDDDDELSERSCPSSPSLSNSRRNPAGTDSMGPPALPSAMKRLISSADSSSLPATNTLTGSGDSEIDMLASARALDPEAVAAREKEFDLSIGKHFDEELPAGSSAATAGGGSGWASDDGSSASRIINAWGHPAVRRRRSVTEAD